MNSFFAQFREVLNQKEVRQNIGGLLSYLAVLLATIVVYSLLFHVIMLYEGQNHSFFTGLYWTLTVMSTLGFGDVTFESDLGRVFSIVVLLSGIVMLLIVLPFTFIRFFYAPWLEAQVRLRAPRSAKADVKGHVILCRWGDITRGLSKVLEREDIPYYVIEPDPVEAAALHQDGISVITGRFDSRSTYEALQVSSARLVLANLGDAENTNIVLTVREVDASVPIVATAENLDSVDVLELSGASEVLALKHELGEQLAHRITAGTPQTHRVGSYKDVMIAEFPLYHTTLPGRTIRDARLRELTGLNIVGVWERGKLLPALPETVLSENSVPVVVGSEEQMTDLDALFAIYLPNENPVLIIGGGKVGIAVARALRRREIDVTFLEKNPKLRSVLEAEADRVVIGDAINHEIVIDAGLEVAPSVVLTSNDDATNIFLTVYCRRLAPDVHIVSRITHNHNLEAIHRAGADFVLSYNSLAVKSVLSLIEGRDLVIVGEGADLIVELVPEVLQGKTLAESEIAARTGLNVIAVEHASGGTTNPPADTELPKDGELVMIGTAEQHLRFRELFT
jgi:Trk K+ transport system NAD-binding subunit